MQKKGGGVVCFLLPATYIEKIIKVSCQIVLGNSRCKSSQFCLELYLVMLKDESQGGSCLEALGSRHQIYPTVLGSVVNCVLPIAT